MQNGLTRLSRKGKSTHVHFSAHLDILFFRHSRLICILTTIRGRTRPWVPAHARRGVNTTHRGCRAEMMRLCPNHPSMPLSVTLSAGYGNNHLNGSIFLHHTLLNTDSVRWKSRLHRIIHSSLGFLKDLFVRRHIMGSTGLTSENTRICGLVSSRQPASSALTCHSRPLPQTCLLA